MRPAILVDKVSKKYRLVRGGETLPYRTLREDLGHLATWPYRALAGQLARTEDFWALKDISFEVQPGSVVGMIGHNGAGKSTMLKLLSRITRPTKGCIRLRGRVGSLLEVGTGFHAELTGRENIYLSGAVLGMKRAEIRRKFDEIVAFAEVETFLDMPVKRYSSGMYMRLAFAVAAHLEPEILLIDEVLAVGDAAFQRKCLGKMGEVAHGGRTVLFVSHNLGAIVDLCPTALWLRAGQLVESGKSSDIVARYLQHSLSDPAEIQSRGNLHTRKRIGDLAARARMVQMRFLNTTSHSAWSMEYGQQVGLAVTVDLHADVEFLQLGVALLSEGNFEFASPLSTDQLQPTPLKSGRYIIEMKLDLLLRPASYKIGLGLRSERGLEDYIPDAERFDVYPNDLSARLDLQSRQGMVIPRIQCEFHRIDDTQATGMS